MKLQKMYSALLTTDLAAAESWYTKLLGRGPDYRPMTTLIQWDLSAEGGLQLTTDDSLARNGALFLVVGDIATERQRLSDLGISLGDDIQGTYSTLAQLRDPDGNKVTLATPPSPPYPAGMISAGLAVSALARRLRCEIPQMPERLAQNGITPGGSPRPSSSPCLDAAMRGMTSTPRCAAWACR